ncbi:MAG: right-handed parallel beta-helix repeat-containing protein, partial [Burkholderiales bacterium]
RIEGCVSAYNKGEGIHYEISSGAHIKNNLVFGNGRRGIYISNSRYSVVEHNLVVFNKLNSIAVNNVSYRESAFPPRGNIVRGNLVAWGGQQELMLPRAAFGNTSNGNLFLDAVPPTFGVWQEGSWPGAKGLAAWRSLSGQDRNSWENVAAMFSSISSTLAARQANVDWSRLKSIALQYRATASGLPPGPTSYLYNAVTQTASVPPASASPAPVQQAVAPPTPPTNPGSSGSSTGSEPTTTVANAPQTAKPTMGGGIPVAMPIPATRPSLPPASAVTPQSIRSLSCSSGYKLYVSLGGTRFREYLYELAARTEFRAYRSALEQCARSF